MTRWIAAGLSGLVAFGAVWAAAAQLTVNSSTLGAGTSVVASCDTNGVDVSYTNSWDAVNKHFKVGSVVVTNLDDACRGKAMTIELQDSSNVSLSEDSGTVATGTTGVNTTTVNMASSVDASAVANISIAIG
jgi:hypothetical protein